MDGIKDEVNYTDVNSVYRRDVIWELYCERHRGGIGISERVST